jgi:acetyl-CoA carboxylase carboxyl transferase subunit alpha
VNISDEILRLRKKSEELTQTIFSDLTSWQITQLARHPMRPHFSDYIKRIFTDFDEIHGDRHFRDDPAMITGIARLDDEPVVIIGNEKGRKTKEKLRRNFGMSHPEGYRKALRAMNLAEKFHLPIITFIDTAGAYPGIAAEERNQSEAIARNLFEITTLKTPIICVVTGEGGSGGALAIGTGDRVCMLQYSIYSVISPEGCASILWKDAARAPEAAEALGCDAQRVYDLGLIDHIIPEPLGGAHRDIDKTAAYLKRYLIDEIAQLNLIDIPELLEQRYIKCMNYVFKDS